VNRFIVIIVLAFGWLWSGKMALASGAIDNDLHTAGSLIHAGNYAGALVSARAAMTDDPNDPGGYMLAGIALLHLGAPDDAVDLFRQALSKTTDPEKKQKILGFIDSARQTGQPATMPPGPAGQASADSPTVHSAPLPQGTYEGFVVFTIPGHARLISHRIIKVTKDQTAILLRCNEYFENDKSKVYNSKLMLIGQVKDSKFCSSNQKCLKTDYQQWLPENITVDFSTNGFANLSSYYTNSSGYVSGTGLLKKK
jgi:hypothetical protein